jgi:hypothetical protein
LPRSVRRALIAIFLLCLALPGQALAARGAAATAERLMVRTAVDLDDVLIGARENLAELADLPAIQNQDADACMTEAQPFGDPRFTAVGASDLDGDLYCLTSGMQSPINIADRAYFLRTLGTRDLGVGDYQIGRATGIDAIGLGYPVIDTGGAVTGIVLSPLALPWLQSRIERRASAKALDSLIVDDHGTVLTRVGEVQTDRGTNLGGSRLVDRALAEDVGSGNFKRPGNVRIGAAWGTVPLSDGAIHVIISVAR